MLNSTFVAFPVLSTPYQIMLFLLERSRKGYRVLDYKLFSIEESKQMITRDDDGLAAINYEGVFDTIQNLSLFDKPLVEPEDLLCIQPLYRSRHTRVYNAPREWQQLEWFKSSHMKREILKEWKEFEDWYFSRDRIAD